MSNWKEDFEKFGYVRIPGVFGQQMVHAIRSAAYLAIAPRLFQDKGALQTVRNEHGYEFPALLFWPKEVSPVLRDATDLICGYVKHFLGDNILQLNNQYYFRHAGDNDQFAWHQDITFRTPKEDYDQIETRYLQTAIIVDEMNSENGGIEFIPDSHKWGECTDLIPRDDSERGLRKFVQGHLAGTTAVAKPGDLLLWSVMVVHGSRPNNSQRSRSYYMNGFAAADAVKVEGRFPWYMRNGRLV